MDFVMDVAQTINGFLWDFALLFLLCGTGVYFTIKLRFVQVTRFKDSFKAVFGQFKFNGKAAGKDGMSSFQSLATAISAQVGTGNLAGAATAIVAGGPGAIFWMWVSAFFGMATIFAEATLSQQYKTTVDGQITGGPVYYIRAAFKGTLGKVLASAFAVFIILALGFMGNMVQSNSIADAFYNAFGASPAIVGLAVSIFAGFVFLGGVKRIASFTEKVVPVMAGLYIVGCVVILAMDLGAVVEAFKTIIISAFFPSAVAGGILGVTVKEAIRFGVARGLFSNEAGMGSTPHAHALAKVKDPCEQGLVAMMGVFIDTFIILTLTALVILTNGVIDGSLTGVALTQSAFANAFGEFGNIFVAICMLFFASSTIVGWYFFAETNVKYLFGTKAVKGFSFLVVCFIFIGSLLKVDLVWTLADTFNGLMVIPNLLALLALSGVVAASYKAFLGKQNQTHTLDK